MQESIIVNHPSILIISGIIVGIIGFLYNKPIDKFVGRVFKRWWLDMKHYKWSIVIGIVIGCAIHYLIQWLL